MLNSIFYATIDNIINSYTTKVLKIYYSYYVKFIICLLTNAISAKDESRIKSNNVDNI